jgi:GDP-D-mannose dehydratase
MLQQPHPDDFVLATGETHMVKEFVNKSFKLVGMELRYAPRVCLCNIKPDWVLAGQGPASKNKGSTSNLAR